MRDQAAGEVGVMARVRIPVQSTRVRSPLRYNISSLFFSTFNFKLYFCQRFFNNFFQNTHIILSMFKVMVRNRVWVSAVRCWGAEYEWMRCPIISEVSDRRRNRNLQRHHQGWAERENCENFRSIYRWKCHFRGLIYIGIFCCNNDKSNNYWGAKGVLPRPPYGILEGGPNFCERGKGFSLPLHYKKVGGDYSRLSSAPLSPGQMIR